MNILFLCTFFESLCFSWVRLLEVKLLWPRICMTFLTYPDTYCDIVFWNGSLQWRVPILPCLYWHRVALFSKTLDKFDKQFLLHWLSRIFFPVFISHSYIIFYKVLLSISWLSNFRQYYWHPAIKMKNLTLFQYLLPLLPLSPLFLLLTYFWLLQWLTFYLKIISLNLY